MPVAVEYVDKEHPEFLDLSFKEFTNFTEIEIPEPTGSPTKDSPSRKNRDDESASPRRMRFRKRYVGLRLSNNAFTSMAGLLPALQSIERSPMPDPVANLQWLDLSFNFISTIDESILELVNLKTLQLHGNQIHSITEYLRLGGLPQLHAFTANGNPTERFGNYRAVVIGALEHLHTLDHTLITKAERLSAARYYKSFQARMAAIEAAKEAEEAMRD